MPIRLSRRFLHLALVAAVLCLITWWFTPSSNWRKASAIPLNIDPTDGHDHPIDVLVRHARQKYKDLLATESHTLEDAAQKYRKRRGRQPPPSFDVWHNFAQNHSAVMVEEFFDPIYENLNPFWAVPAQQMRDQANGFLFRISVRNGNISHRSDDGDRPWMHLWQDMMTRIAPLLPDVDVPINVMDESRMVAPWEEIRDKVDIERASRKVIAADQLKTTYQSLASLNATAANVFDPAFEREGQYWPKAVIGCPPDSPARLAPIETEFRSPPPLKDQQPLHSYKGYVQNWTIATSPCDIAEIQSIHGTFVEPISLANTRQLFPLFGGSKLPMNNEILIPPAMYWTDDPFYSGGNDHGREWEKKENKMIWRGGASGGRNRENNWTRFQRHRFIAAVNATSVHEAETTNRKPVNFILPQQGLYDVFAWNDDPEPGSFSKWIKTWSDVATVHLQCFPNEPDNDKHCSYADPYFDVAPAMPMKEQYNFKYLPDIDGNSFSGRYRGFLGSTSLPIKATIYQEWHDSRLVPWKHFVPMDNTFIDIYGIMEYFVGNTRANIAGHDAVAKAIATDGKTWAEKVLRKADMEIYVFRLLLEFARLCDDDRERMGWREGRDR